MSDLLIGTDRGVFRLDTDGTARPEEGPASVASFARAHDGLLALTRDGALWRATGAGPWQLAKRWTVPPPPHIPHVRSVAPGPKVVGAVYIGVEEGGINLSEDRGETWDPAVRLDGQARC